MTWDEYISSYQMMPEQIQILESQKNGPHWSLEFESLSGGDLSYHVHTIFAIARGIYAKNIVDLGVRNGQATRALLWAAHYNQGKVYSVDIEDCSHACPPTFQKYWNFYKLSTDQFYEEFQKNQFEIDLLVIDADHSYGQSLKDFENFFPYVRPNGFILMHDVYPAKESRKKWPDGAGGVWKTWDTIYDKYSKPQSNNIDPSLDMLKLPFCCGMGIIRKKGPLVHNKDTGGFREETPNNFFYGCDIDALRYSSNPDQNTLKRGRWDKSEFKQWQESFIKEFD